MIENSFFIQIEEEMKKVVEAFEKESNKFRPGKASANMLDGVFVEAYGTPTPLLQVAQINVPDPGQLVVKPFDKTLVSHIAAGIVKANLNLTPLPEGDLIRINVPKLTEEIRKKMVKELEKELENFKVRVRNIRRDHLNKIKKDTESPKDAVKDNETHIQKITDTYISELDKSFKLKEKDILSI